MDHIHIGRPFYNNDLQLKKFEIFSKKLHALSLLRVLFEKKFLHYLSIIRQDCFKFGGINSNGGYEDRILELRAGDSSCYILNITLQNKKGYHIVIPLL